MLSPKFMSEEESGLDSETNEPVFIVHSPQWRSEGMLLLLNCTVMSFLLQILFAFLTVLQTFISKLDKRLAKLPKKKGFSMTVQRKGVDSSCSAPCEPVWAVSTTLTTSPVEPCDDVPDPTVNVTTSTDVDLDGDDVSDEELRDMLDLYK